MIVAVIVILLIVVVLLVIGVNVYNGIVRKDNRCDNAWQTIDALMQRRNDLIPDLVACVKDYTGDGPDVVTEVTSACKRVEDATSPEATIAASDQLLGALSHLMLVVEDYPELKSSANFQQLQANLTDIEDKLNYARTSYSDCVLEYNNAITTFPGSFIAGSKFRKRTGFEIVDDAARTAADKRS